MATKYEKVTVTVAGSAGTATGSAKTRPITGLLLAVYLDYVTQPATADVTIATAGSGYPAQTLLTLTNANTDGWFYPRLKVHDSAGVAATAATDVVALADAVVISVAQGDAGSVAVTLVYEG
jgi:hypothetical protein